MDIYEVIEALKTDKIIKVEEEDYSNKYWFRTILLPFKLKSLVSVSAARWYGDKRIEKPEDMDYEHGVEINLNHLEKMRFSIVTEDEMFKDCLEESIEKEKREF